PHTVGEKSVVDHRRLITVTPFRMTRSGGGVLDDSNLETLLEKLAQMGFDADIGQHAAKYDLANPALAELQDQVVGLGSPNLVRADDDRLPVFDIRLEPVQPVGAGFCKARQGQRSSSRKCVGLEFVSLKGAVEVPGAVRRIEVVRGNEHFISIRFSRFKY